jgi:hypothetical protein
MLDFSLKNLSARPRAKLRDFFWTKNIFFLRRHEGYGLSKGKSLEVARRLYPPPPRGRGGKVEERGII